jgi:hypothetical protein
MPLHLFTSWARSKDVSFILFNAKMLKKASSGIMPLLTIEGFYYKSKTYPNLIAREVCEFFA